MNEHPVNMNPTASDHIPGFIVLPGESDSLMLVVGILVVLAILGLGVFYFKLHALPEQVAHRGQKVQFQIVAVLALLALFTHNHIFWIAGLLLALVPIPDFITPLSSMARSLDRMAGRDDRAPEAAAPVVVEPVPLDEHRPLEQRSV